MGYNKEELEKQSLKIIKDDENVVFVEDVVAKLPCSHATFYNHELDKLDSIKNALAENRTNKKLKLRTKWSDNDNPTLQIALYKLIGDNDDLDRLAGQRIDHTTKGDKITSPPVSDKILSEIYQKHKEEQDSEDSLSNHS